MNHIEQEFKWACTCEADFENCLQAIHRLAVRCVGPEKLSITDTYLDTPQRSLSAQKVALRVRQVEGVFEATLKTKTALKNGMACRQEITLPLKDASTLPRALEHLKMLQKWEGVEVALVDRIFTIKNQRHLYQLTYKKCQCEAAFDRYVTQAQGHQWLRREIELELKKGAVKDFLQLAQKITQLTQLPAAKISKVAGAEKWIKEKLGKTNF